jgi:hypothetical protein
LSHAKIRDTGRKRNTKTEGFIEKRKIESKEKEKIETEKEDIQGQLREMQEERTTNRSTKRIRRK